MTEGVTGWLDKTAGLYPDKIALHDEREELTYREYQIRAKAIAGLISEKKIIHSPVVVFLEKGVQIPVSFFGIAYSRNFYSPIDTELPKARISLILSILQPKLAVTRRSLVPALEAAGFRGEYIFIEDIASAAAEFLPSAEYNPEDLLYVLFTSGSTGVPKGVTITHRSVINYIEWAVKTFSFTETDSFGNQAPFYFDNSILDIYCAVKSGAELFIIPKSLFAQPIPLLNYLKEHQISTIFWVPSALIIPAQLKAFRNVDLTASLKRVLFCGEVMPVRHLNIWRHYLPDVCYANLYGPTEITDACTCYIVDRQFGDRESLPIGKPISGVEILLVSEEDGVLRKTLEGDAGEICVTGVCLSPGYFRNPEKTAEVFIRNPFGDGIIYRTGDIGRFNEKGELMYISRRDFQIKHLGHRIELGEIEAAADSVPEISCSCALYDKNRHKIVLFAETAETAEYVGEKLAELLPVYMYPNKIIIMDKIPINCNGKIDRALLMESVS